MTLHDYFKSEKIPQNLDAIVIGSGIGGLATAALLAKSGKRVLVLERHYVAGGFTHTFQRKGYEWDVGVHYIGEVHRPTSVLARLFSYITDGSLKWQEMDPVYDRICFPDKTYDYVAPLTAWKETMYGYFPEEKAAIDQYIDAVFAVTQATKNFFMERALPPLIGKVAAPFLTKKFHRYSDRTTLEVLQSFTSNTKLIGVLTGQYGDYGMPPAQSSFAIHAIVTRHYFSGGAYPVGGSKRIAESILPVIEAAGGRVLVKAEVDQILIKNDRAYGVKLTSGEEILAPVVVSDAGVLNTWQKLIEDRQSPSFLQEFKQIGRSASHLCLYLGMKETAEQLNLSTTNLWIYPGYDHDKTMADFLRDPEAPLPVVYLSFPSAKDPDFTKHFPGRATMEAVSFAPYEWFRSWENSPWHKRGEDYDALKERLSQRILDVIYQWVPQLKGKVDYYELSTPLSTRHFCNYEAGEIYGLNHSPSRFRQKHLRPRTPVKNLFLTGQDIVSDGVGGALMGGVLAASAIEKKNILGDIFKS